MGLIKPPTIYYHCYLSPSTYIDTLLPLDHHPKHHQDEFVSRGSGFDQSDISHSFQYLSYSGGRILNLYGYNRLCYESKSENGNFGDIHTISIQLPIPNPLKSLME